MCVLGWLMASEFPVSSFQFPEKAKIYRPASLETGNWKPETVF
jgi:hypothetical protein